MILSEQMQEANPFSLIADFEGDIEQLFRMRLPKTLPVLPLRNMCAFPGVVVPVTVMRERSRQLIAEAERKGGLIAVVAQRNPDDEMPSAKDLYDIGVVARVMRLMQLPSGGVSVILQTFGRVRLMGQTKYAPYMRCYVEALEETLPAEDDKEFSVLVDACRDATAHYLRMSENVGDEAVFAVKNIKNPFFLLSFVATNLPFDTAEKQELLAEDDVKARGYRLLTLIGRENQYASMKQNIQQQAHEDLNRQQREYFLQQQMKNIKSQLGEDDQETQELRAVREKAANLKWPDAVRETFNREADKLRYVNPASGEYPVQLSYLQMLTDLPWGTVTEDTPEFNTAQRTLETQHYGLERVKERILEQIAMARFRKARRMPILCLYGPPGVGKTSLGRSIAEALGRKYVRISLGGVHDEAEIRGHRRTYIGAMPGRIVKALLKAGTDNPVFVLDEIDKVQGQTHNGDPQSALLEVLDPEQNAAFHDNYIDVDYDLSRVFFVCTANSLSGIPRPLLDRMELIEVEGYLPEEKCEIARRHLIPRIEEELTDTAQKKLLQLLPSGLDCIIDHYTRESGVRGLEKQIKTLYRKVALNCLKRGDTVLAPMRIGAKQVKELLGKPLYHPERYQRTEQCGVTTGLAWTEVGGEILFVETSISESKTPKLTLTGNLGDVMKESAQLALEYVKSHARDLGIDVAVFETHSIHVHVPEGATPKDGPSAGITIATSIASALTHRPVRPATAMTGEITLRGKVLPVGGIKEKILAAKRAGITDIVLCTENRRDIDDIEAKYLAGVKFHYVETVKEVLRFALDKITR